MKRYSSVLLFAALAACSGGGGGTNTPTVQSVTISTASPSVAVGQSVQLTASAHLSDGTNSTTGLSWSSLDPAIATVSAGLVSGVATGTARIVAAAGSRADTVAVTVSGGCAPGTVLNLAVGGSTVVSGGAAGTICVGGVTGGADYTLVPFNGSAVASSLSLQASAAGAVSVASTPNPVRIAAAGALDRPRAGLREDEGYHLRLMRQNRGLTSLVPAARSMYRGGGARRSVALADPVVGDLLSLNVNSDQACSNPILKTARVEAVGTHAIVVADTTNPKNGFSSADYQQVASEMDALVWPVDTEAFGEPADIDNNSRVIILYTRAVNELTPAGANYYVGGFFFARDLFPKVATPSQQACAGSNVAEMFYMLAADPLGEVNGNTRSRDFVFEKTIATVGHEFQHLISASRRLFMVGAPGDNWSEDVWLNEGMSHIAEELIFYRASGLNPRTNIALTTLQGSAAAADAFNAHQSSNFGRFEEYLADPEHNSPIADNDELATRGATWAFLRYAADRRGGAEQPFWFNLVNSTQIGLTNLSAQLGQDPMPWLRDFNTAVYTDDAVAAGATFSHPSWNYRSIYDFWNDNPPYPLETHNLSGSSTSISLLTAGAAYLRVGTGSGATVPVQITSSAALPATFSVTVVRTR